MNVIINWNDRKIYVPKSEMRRISDTLYELDINEFRLALKDKEDDSDGIVNPDTHIHYPPVTFGNVTLARVVQIINGYKVEFENGVYAVDLIGANSNIADVVVLNGVSIRSYNSAGLVHVSSDGGVDYNDIASAVWSYIDRTLTDFGDVDKKLDMLLDIEQGNWKIENNQMIFYKRDGSELMRFNLYDKNGLPSDINVFMRRRI